MYFSTFMFLADHQQIVGYSHHPVSVIHPSLINSSQLPFSINSGRIFLKLYNFLSRFAKIYTQIKFLNRRENQDGQQKAILDLRTKVYKQYFSRLFRKGLSQISQEAFPCFQFCISNFGNEWKNKMAGNWSFQIWKFKLFLLVISYCLENQDSNSLS